MPKKGTQTRIPPREKIVKWPDLCPHQRYLINPGQIRLLRMAVQPIQAVSFKPTAPVMIRATNAIRARFTGSWNTTIPNTVMPTAPKPVQTA